MLKRIFWLSLVLALTACGDDDAATDAGDHNDDHAKAGSGAADAGGFSNVACNPTGTGACQNTPDCPIIIGGTARSSAQTCGQGCLGQPDQKACARACVIKDTKLSEGCADCYVNIVDCTIMNCVSACLSDANSTGCYQCQVEKGCRATFDTCSGLPPAPAP